MGMRGSAARGVEELYAASYVRLVGVVAAIARDRDEAKEVVQEAFVRLLRHWPKVLSYEDPEAWVRGAALRLLSNHRRKAVNAVRAVVRLGAPAAEPPPSSLPVDLARAVAALPRQQREAVVLHRLDLGPEEVAATLGIAVGRRSRVCRGREPRSRRC
jgi:RNA polymerase sigma-70 factor (ECF subfamily)